MIKSAEGSAGLLHKITKPAAWRGGAQILENGQSIGSVTKSVQYLEDKPWTSEDLKKLEEALPRLKECDLEKASRLYKAKAGVGCDGFHPEVPLDLTKERAEVVELTLGKSIAKWKMAATTLHDDFLFDHGECCE